MANPIPTYSIHILFVILAVYFVRISAAVSANCSARTSSTYCFDSGLPSKWHNNNSIVMKGWQMRVFLVKKLNDSNVAFYCGFYCRDDCNTYVFSVIAVGGSNHELVWTANPDRPVKANATVELTTAGLVLRDSDNSGVWSSPNSLGNGSIVGMNLDERGSLALFNSQSATLWEAPASKLSANVSNSPPASGEDTPVVLPPPPPPRPALPPASKPDLPPKPSPAAAPSMPGPSPVSRHQMSRFAYIFGSIAAAAVTISILLFLIRRAKRRKANVEIDVDGYLKQVPGMPMRFSYLQLHLATEDFKERLGGGGFGSVFKGVLPDGTPIAVKRLDKLGQGVKEFLAEVETIGSLHHFNLVRLIGFCAEKSCRLLVYEYLSNGSLDNWIFNKHQGPCLDWQTKKRIILDIAKGLAYLHEDCRQRIIHLDIKPQNILLDQNFNAKVSDFGLSELINRDESQVLTTMRGTPGYLAPEWTQQRITVKVDIYSFGIVLLEVVSGRKNFDRSRSESTLHLLEVLQKKAAQERLIDIVDNLDEDMQNNREEVIRMIKIGAWCLQDDPNRRPLMSTVVKVLEGVMQVDPNIIYHFSHVLTSSPSSRVVVNEGISLLPTASVLSNPR
uniref:non-specific serine/threonine protein kinase n=1 Tax=Rhizophora mucronata TaxID=61149 RepID=A0A2P2KJB6_RHIMU